MEIQCANPLRVAVVDPGQTSGVVLGTFPPLEVLAAKEICSLDYLLDYLTEVGPDLIVYEDFVLRRGKALGLAGSRIYSAEVIGAIKAHFRKSTVRLEGVPPSNMSIATDTLLRCLGLTKIARGKPHAKDALRHFVAWAMLKLPEGVIGDGMRKVPSE